MEQVRPGSVWKLQNGDEYVVMTRIFTEKHPDLKWIVYRKKDELATYSCLIKAFLEMFTKVSDPAE